MYLDARYERVRQAGLVQKAAVLIAVGVDESGKRCVLGVSDALLRRMVQKYEATAPKLAAWLEESLPEGLAVLAFPEPHRRLLRTTNGVERVNREIKRRTQVASIFPNEASCLRLVSALLMEISDDWQAGKAYLTFSEP